MPVYLGEFNYEVDRTVGRIVEGIDRFRPNKLVRGELHLIPGRGEDLQGALNRQRFPFAPVFQPFQPCVQCFLKSSVYQVLL